MNVSAEPDPGHCALSYKDQNGHQINWLIAGLSTLSIYKYLVVLVVTCCKYQLRLFNAHTLHTYLRVAVFLRFRF